MRLGISDGRKLIRKIISPTPVKFKDGMAQFLGMIMKLNPGEKITAGFGGVAGPLDKTKSFLLDCNLKDWKHKPVKYAISKIIKAPVTLENDSGLCALGEANFGAGKQSKIMGYLTFSTGVGGSRTVNGQIDFNHFGFEPKYSLVSHKGKLVRLEKLVSGMALQKKYGKPAHLIRDKHVWDDVALWIKVASSNAVCMWSCETLVIGGGIGSRSNISAKSIENFIKNSLPDIHHYPKVAKAKLKSLSGLYGAIALIREKNKKPR